MDAVLNLDKPRGITSQEAVTKVKRALRVRKAGHAGTLDPIATGVLLVCLGEATKISRFLMGLEKEYLATVKFGERTDTLDAEGRVVEAVATRPFALHEVEAALDRFKGVITQRPPVYSAIKRSGRPLYELARKGVIVEPPERRVTIRRISVEEYDFPLLGIRVTCSSGTYIRSLSDDLGRALGGVAHMAALRRTRIGGFGVEDASSLESLLAGGATLVSPDDALGHLRGVRLSPGDFRMASNGRAVEAGLYGDFEEGQWLSLKTPEGLFFAVGKAFKGTIRIERMLHLLRKP